MKRLRHTFVFAAILAQIHCAKSPNPQDSCGYVQNSQAQRVSWKNQNPIDVYIDSNVPIQYHQAIQTSFQTWENAIGHKVFRLLGVISSQKAAQDGKSIVYWENPWQGEPHQQANTVIYWLDNKIVEADIRINAQYFMYSAAAPTPNEVDLQSLVTHEVGHFLGLDHKTNTASVMAKSLDQGVERRTLYSTDQSSIKCEYL